MLKKAAAVLVVLALGVTMLAGCQADVKLTGKYYLTSYVVLETGVDTMEGWADNPAYDVEMMYMEFFEDGTATMVVMGQQTEFAYTCKGTNIRFTNEAENTYSVGTLDGDVITVEELGYRMVFTKK